MNSPGQLAGASDDLLAEEVSPDHQRTERDQGLIPKLPSRLDRWR